MTAREALEGAQIELSKVHAPSLTLEEYNYYINKAINNYTNKRYNIYDVNLQTTDDMRVLKSSAVLKPERYTTLGTEGTSYMSTAYPQLSNDNRYEVELPSDYLHLLNCVCVYKVNKNYKCYDSGSYVYKGAKRLTADSWTLIMDDYYNRPTPLRPYFYIHNTNLQEDDGFTKRTIPTNPIGIDDDGLISSGTDMVGLYHVTNNDSNEGSNFNRKIKISNSGNDDEISTVTKASAHRYGNASPVRMEIRYGKDSSIFELVLVKVDYIKVPQHIRVTQEQMDLTEDTSQILEFPDFVCQEIINELVLLLMERDGDPRLQTTALISLTIANPAQQLLVAAQAASE